MNPTTLLMTRPREASERFVSRLSQAAIGALDVVIDPLMEIVPTHTPVPLVRSEAVLFTSANGVRLAPVVEGGTAFCVGSLTAREATRRGWTVHVTAKDADELVSRLISEHTPMSLHHLAGHHRRGEIAKQLGATGWQVTVTELYDQHLLPLSSATRDILAGEARVILPLFSPRTAAHLSREMTHAPNTKIIALSPAVAAEINASLVASVHVVAAPTGDMMAQAVEMLAQNLSSP